MKSLVLIFALLFPVFAHAQGYVVTPLDEQNLPPELKAYARESIRGMREKGYVETSDAVIEFFARGGKRPDAGPPGRAKVRIKPSSVKRTSLGRAALEGVVAHGSLTDEGWSGMSRLYRLADGSVVEVEESEYASAVLSQEFVNEVVGSYPAVLIVQKSPSKGYLVELAWYTEQRAYLLRTNTKHPDKARDELLELARELTLAEPEEATP